MTAEKTEKRPPTREEMLENVAATRSRIEELNELWRHWQRNPGEGRRKAFASLQEKYPNGIDNPSDFEQSVDSIIRRLTAHMYNVESRIPPEPEPPVVSGLERVKDDTLAAIERTEAVYGRLCHQVYAQDKPGLEPDLIQAENKLEELNKTVERLQAAAAYEEEMGNGS